jgi:DNA-directed RNA polymerase subunit RPC12/RpoP
MKKKLCTNCGVETWHNPRKISKPGEEPGYRCVQCGLPRRFGNLNPKNIVTRVGSGIFAKIMFGG